MKRVRSVFLLFLMGLALVSSVATQAAKPKVTMAYGVSSSQPLRDFFKKIYESVGVELVMVELPSQRQVEDFNKGAVDAIIFLNEDTFKNQITNGLAVGMGEGQPLFKYEFLGYVLTSRWNELNARADYKGLAIGHTQGNPAQAGMIARLGATAVSAADMNSAVLMLANGRFDILMTVKGAPDEYVKKNALEGKIQVLDKPLVMTLYYHVLSKNNAGLAAKLSKALLDNKAEFMKLIRG